MQDDGLNKHIDEKENGWRKQHNNFKVNVLKSLPFEAPWAQAGKECVGIAPDAERARDVIELVALSALQEARSTTKPGQMQTGVSAFNAKLIMERLICDISQNPIRGGKTSRCKGNLGCLCSSSHIFIYARDFLLPGRYHHLISGYPDNLDWECMLEPPDTRTLKRARTSTKVMDKSKRSLDRAVRQRIGESYCLPQAATAHAAVFLLSGMPWWRSSVIIVISQ